jgi:hypothetical protein
MPISRFKITVESEPKYRMTEMPSKSSRKLSETRKYRFPSSTVILEMPLLARAEPSIFCSEAGRQIDFNDEQPESAVDSIRVSFDPDSNVKSESEPHHEKQSTPRDSTEAGRQIDFSSGQSEIAHASIRISFDPDSNVNDESDQHDEKEFSPRNSTDDGRQIDRNDE